MGSPGVAAGGLGLWFCRMWSSSVHLRHMVTGTGCVGHCGAQQQNTQQRVGTWGASLPAVTSRLPSGQLLGTCGTHLMPAHHWLPELGGPSDPCVFMAKAAGEEEASQRWVSTSSRPHGHSGLQSGKAQPWPPPEASGTLPGGRD